MEQFAKIPSKGRLKSISFEDLDAAISIATPTEAHKALIYVDETNMPDSQAVSLIEAAASLPMIASAYFSILSKLISKYAMKSDAQDIKLAMALHKMLNAHNGSTPYLRDIIARENLGNLSAHRYFSAAALMSRSIPADLADFIVANNGMSAKNYGRSLANRKTLISAVNTLLENGARWIGHTVFPSWKKAIEENGWHSELCSDIENLTSFPPAYLAFVMKDAPDDVKHRTAEKIIFRSQDANEILGILYSKDDAGIGMNIKEGCNMLKRLFSSKSMPTGDKIKVMEAVMMISVDSEEGTNAEAEEANSELLSILASDSDKAAFDYVAGKEWWKYAQVVKELTGNTDRSLDRYAEIKKALDAHPSAWDNVDPAFAAYHKMMRDFSAGGGEGMDLDDDLDALSWMQRSELKKESGKMKDVGRALLMAYLLVTSGISASTAMRWLGVTGKDVKEHPEAAAEAKHVMNTVDSDPNSRRAYDEAMRLRGQMAPRQQTHVVQTAPTRTPAPKPPTAVQTPRQEKMRGGMPSDILRDEKLLAEISDDHSYIASRIGGREYEIIKEAADEYGLTGVQRKLLFSIRIIEHGGPGLEMGVGDGIPNHPARRYAGNFEKSLKLQAQWAAGTIKRNFSGGPAFAQLPAFAQHYCPPNWKNWQRMAYSLLTSRDNERGEMPKA